MPIKSDFPYYDGQPVEISPMGWVMLLVSVVAAFGLLITLPFDTFPLNLVPAIVFTGIPLLTLAAVTGGRQAALFGRFGIRDFFTALGFGVLTVVVSVLVGLILSRLTDMQVNPAATMLASIGPFDVAVFMVRTFVQLIGEELMTMLPLLAVLWFCVRKLNMLRRAGLVIAVVISTIWFAAVHLPTYNWNVLQCFGGIGAARLVLTAAFLVTRRLWVSAGAHIINDWSEFVLPLILDAAASQGPIDTVG